MSTKREAAVRVVEAARIACDELPMCGSLQRVVAALAAFDAAPDDAEAGREERTEAQKWVDTLAPSQATEGDIPIVLMALRDDLRALAASVKERR